MCSFITLAEFSASGTWVSLAIILTWMGEISLEIHSNLLSPASSWTVKPWLEYNLMTWLMMGNMVDFAQLATGLVVQKCNLRDLVWRK